MKTNRWMSHLHWELRSEGPEAGADIGQRYTGRRRWPEQNTYTFRGNRHELVLFWKNLSLPEIEDVRHGRLTLALWVQEALNVLLFKFEAAAGQWQQAPFSWHLLPAAARFLPDETIPNFLFLTLVNATTGIVSVQRTVELKQHFATDLAQALKAQGATPWDEVAYRDAAARISRLYTSQVLAQQARSIMTSE